MVPFCITSKSSSNIVYIDSSAVPLFTNITCFCTIHAGGRVNVTKVTLEPGDQLETSTDNKTFTNPFINANSHVFVTGVFLLRYKTYDQRLTSLCVRLDGNNKQVSCERVTNSQTVQASTSSTYPYTDFDDNYDTPPSSTLDPNTTAATLDPKATAGTAKENKQLQNGT